MKGFPGGSDSKEFPCSAGDLGLIPELGRPPGGGPGNALQYSCLRIPWKEEPGGLQDMGSQRVGHDWLSTLDESGGEAEKWESYNIDNQIQCKL